MIRSCIKRLALLANLAGKGNLLVLTLLLVVLSSLILAYQAIYTREQVNAAPNNNINFQARILTNTGALVSDGNYSVEFKIYDSVAGPTSQWNETQVVTVKNGYLSVSLGSANPFSGIDWSQEQWLTMNINGDGEMAPRMKVTAVPFALRSNQAETLTNGSGTISASSLAQLSPGSVQSINSVNSLLRISQLGGGGLLQLANSGGDKFTVANNGDTTIGGSLSVNSGVTLGNSSSTTAGTIRWTGSVFEGYNGTSWSSLGGSALGNPIINKVKLADEIQNSAVNATATLQNDDELFFSVGANETWTFRFMIQGNANATPDYKFAVTAPSGATCKISTADHEAGASVANLGCGVSTGLVTGNTANDLYEVVGTVTNGPNAGTVQLQWAQNTANAANSTIYAGSSVLATRAVGPNGSAQAFIQNGNSFGADAYLGTNDNNNLNFITNGTTKMTVLANGNVGIGDSTPSSLLTVGSSDAFQVDSSGNVSTSGTLTVSGLSTFNNSIVAGATATGTVSATEPTPRANVTSVITTTAVFANNDVIFINNAGQDYYTRVVSGGGTTNLVVSPAVSYDASATVTKYNIQNIGATSTDYTTQANRFFQGYFTGGVVIGAGSTTISDGNIESTTTLRLQQNGGALDIGGNLNIAGSITGNGSGLTNIDGSQISGGSIQDGSLSANVTLAGNTFNGVSQLLQLNASGKVDDSLLSTNITAAGNTFNGANQLVQLNGSGYLPTLNASNLTNINASNISSGTLDDARLSSSVTLAGNTFNGVNQLIQLDGSGNIPILNGSNLTSLNAGNISSGTIDNARLNSNVTLAGNSFNGASQLIQLNGSGEIPALSGVNLTSLNATNISSGTLDNARLNSTVTLAGNTFNGVSQLLQLNASGKVDDSLLSTNITAAGNTFNGNNQLLQLNASGALPALSGANLTSLNATNISSGTVDNARLNSTVTLAGNTFNGVSQLIQLNGSGEIPALSGANLTSINASNISSGTLDTARLGTTVTLAGNTFNGANQLVQLNGSGYLPTLNASNLTNINASNISSGTLDDARLTTSVTLAGNTFNGASQLVRLNGLGALPALSGANLTSLNASNISSGTLDTARLSTTVTLAGNTFNGASQLLQLNASGALPALSGANLTSLNASNISSGTLDNARLNSTVTLAGNSFNGVSQLIQLNGSGEIPALSGANLTSMNATNISSGTINDGRLSSNVCLINSDACGYIRLASGSAQADSSTNSSIFINKTGASGDIITLRDNGTDVFRVANDGSLEIRQTSTTALAIKNASGTDFFNVDSSGAIVRIGSATADGTGTLLVLDTKNTAGDPTGVNGGMYYNSVDGKNRCYEDGVWVDCITTKLAGETTLASASGTISVNLNDSYEYLECRMDIVSRSAASIPYLRFNNNTGGTSYTWNTYGIVAAAPTDWQDASDSEVQLTGTQTGTNIVSADMKITNLSGFNKVVDWTAAGVEAVGTNSNRYSGVGGFYSTAQVTSIQIVASTGTFGAGSHVWCQGKNVR
jgi:hypothetical protein